MNWSLILEQCIMALTASYCSLSNLFQVLLNCPMWLLRLETLCADFSSCLSEWTSEAFLLFSCFSLADIQNKFELSTKYKIMHQSRWNSRIIIIIEMMSVYTRKLVVGVTGILVSTIAISYFVEKIFSGNYTDYEGKKQRFIYPSLVTWMGCLFCSLYGITYAAFVDKTPNRIEVQERFRLGALFTLNYLPTNYALLYISYPLQVVAKNTRYLLVVIVGVFFSRVKKNRQLKLPHSKLIIAVVISAGAGLFMFFDTKDKAHQPAPGKKWIGLILLLLAIICDAFFSDSQAYCKATFKPSQNQLFLAANLYGFLLIFIFALVSGQLVPSLEFLVHNPSARLDILLVASLQVISQISVYYVINNFKQHIYPLISTVRKLLTILFSIFIFNHKMHFYQWVSIAIVFVAMGYEMYDQVQSQEYHRKIRRQRKQKAYIEGRETQEGQGDHSEYLEVDHTPQEMSLIKDKSQHSDRSNIHMNNQVNKHENNDESLSKYAYEWRRKEVAEDRETSLTPQKTKNQ